MTLYLVPIVEGQTEVGCIERLLQRVWAELLAATERLQVLPASRGKRDALINPDHPDFTAKIEEAYAKLARRLRYDTSGQGRGMLLLLLDAEKDCPAALAPRIFGGCNSDTLGHCDCLRDAEANVGELDRCRRVHPRWGERPS